MRRNSIAAGHSSEAPRRRESSVLCVAMEVPYQTWRDAEERPSRRARLAGRLHQDFERQARGSGAGQNWGLDQVPHLHLVRRQTEDQMRHQILYPVLEAAACQPFARPCMTAEPVSPNSLNLYCQQG
jgi:hypothetical protein